MSALIAARGVSAGYHGHAVVSDLDLEISAGQVAALLGSNGAGKTTTLLTLAGDLPALAGDVVCDGVSSRKPLHRRARDGLSFVTEDRSVFMRMTVADNLRVGNCNRDRALEMFPELEPLLDRTAGLLSGGEQQILTVARALARRPKVMLADELSLGLAPFVVERLLKAVRQAATDEGVGVLLVEQHVEKAIAVADEVYVMNRGRVVLRGPAHEVSGRLHEVEDLYLSAEASVDDHHQEKNGT